MGGWRARLLYLTASFVSAVLVGVWINRITDLVPDTDLWGAMRRLGWSNLLLLSGVGVLAIGDFVGWRLNAVDTWDFQRRYELLKIRQRRILESTLDIVCTLTSNTLGIAVNARYFVAESDASGRTYLRQDRDLAVLTIPMPREFGFTRIYVDTPHIVAGRAYRERLPLYEELPVDHTAMYDADVARMIEPTQRWVLACPVLRLDLVTNRHDTETPPHGVIVFYGTDLPAEPAAVRVRDALKYAQTFAEHMSHVLNMLELSSPGEVVDGSPQHAVP